MKKTVKLFSFLIIALLVLSACGNQSSPSTSEESPQGTKKESGGEITIWATNINVPVIEKAGELFKKDNPKFNLKVVEMNNTDIDKKLKIGLQAGGQGLPDAMLLVDDGLVGLLDKFPNAFVNLSEKGFDQHKDQFPANKLGNVTFNNSIYAFPFDAGPVGVFYRTDLFQEAGVDASQIKTWEDYIETGKKIKEKTGVSMLSYDANESTVYTILLSQQGLGYFDENGKVTLGTEEAMKASKLMQDLAANDLLLNTSGWSPWVASLAEGKTATAMAGAWLIGTLEQQIPDSAGKWGVMAVPTFEEGQTGGANQGGSSFVINSTSPNIDLAYQFLEFFSTSYEVQEIAMEGGLFPTYAPVYESDLFSKPLDYFGGQKAWEFFAEQIALVPPVSYSVHDVVAREEAIKSQAEVVNGADVKESLENAVKRVESRIQ